MNDGPLKSRRGRRPAWKRKLLRRTTCRDCPLRRPGGGCRDSGLWSGRCGDYVWFVRRGKQLRRVWVKPRDPRTGRQRICRARLGVVSAFYSVRLTDAEQDAHTAAGAKRRCRRRLGDSGTMTGHQYLVHKELAGKAAGSRKRSGRKIQVPQSQVLTTKFGAQVPEPQALTRTTWGPHWLHTGTTPSPQRGRQGGWPEG